MYCKVVPLIFGKVLVQKFVSTFFITKLHPVKCLIQRDSERKALRCKVQNIVLLVSNVAVLQLSTAQKMT